MTALASAPTATAGSRFASVRAKIVSVVLIGVLAAIAVGAAGILASRSQRHTATETARLASLQRQVEAIKYYDADTSGWQVAYAADVETLGPKKAVAPDSENRKGFLADAAAVKQLLSEVDTGAMTAAERAQYDETRSLWDQYFAADNRAVAHFANGTPAAVKAGKAQIKLAAYDIYGKLLSTTTTLVDSVQERADRLEKGAQREAARAVWIIVVTLAVGLAVALALGLLISGRLVGRVRRVAEAMEAAAEGDLTPRVEVDSTDEIGAMARSFNALVDATGDAVNGIAGQASQLRAASGELAAASVAIAAGAEESSTQAGMVAAAAEQVSRNVQTVATGSEEMGASIAEIAHNAAEAARVAGRAVTVASSATDLVGRLGESSGQIDSVVKVITSIAEQTNLLALNATIEAARAGEAGKGFAVVATEVKELAQETARATEDISRQIATIQGDTEAAVQAIREISAVIERINDFQTTIASAVEEQTATTNEMNRNVAEAATGSGEIAMNVSGVATAAAASTEQVHQAQHAVSQLTAMAEELTTLVGRFRTMTPAARLV